MKRQALTTTISELQDLIVNLSQQLDDVRVITNNGYGNIKFQVNIINKEGLSDTWKLEDSQEGENKK